MDRGNDFLKSQVNNAVAQHGTFLKALEDHEGQVEDQRFRDLCTRFIPVMRSHQRMLEDYQQELGADAGLIRKAFSGALSIGRDLADATREGDFMRLLGDVVLSRQIEGTFKTFRDAGRYLGLTRLAQIGEAGERDHDAYHKEANRLVQQMFVEQVRASNVASAQRPRYTNESTL